MMKLSFSPAFVQNHIKILHSLGLQLTIIVVIEHPLNSYPTDIKKMKAENCWFWQSID